MRSNHGFSLLELMTAVAIVATLATLGYAGFEPMWEKSNFRTMQEFGIELALNQQLHRQRYGRYALDVTSAGVSSPTVMVMPTANKYVVSISMANFRGYSAVVKPSPEAPIKLPEECRILLVKSDMGLQRFGTMSATDTDTSSQCIPHG